MRFPVPVALSVQLLGVVGSAAAQGAATDTTLVWPAPPDTARIRYVGALRSERDLGRSETGLRRLWRRLTGGGGPSYLRIERPFDIHVVGARSYVTNGTIAAVIVFDGDTRRARLLGADVPGGLGRPMGMGGDEFGRLYVADPGMRRVVVFDADGHFARAFGGSAELLNPVDVAVDLAANRVYVVDGYQHQVVVFDTAGLVVQRIGRQEGALAARDGRVSERGRPGDATSDSVPARDHGAAVADGAGDPSDVWENRGGRVGEFRYPVAAAVGAGGALWVSDQMNFRVQGFDRAGLPTVTIGRLGDTPGSFTRPKGVAVDRDGHVYVVDAAFNNVQVFDAAGRLLLAFGQLGHGPGQHWLPLGLFIDARDRVLVADRYNNRIQIYQYLTDGPEAAAPPARAGVR